MKNRERKHFKMEILIPCTAHHKAGAIGYTMSRSCAQTLLNARKGSEKGMSPQQYLVSYINRTYNLLHYCDRVVLTDG